MSLKQIKFRKALRKLREEKGLSLRDLQKATGIWYVTLSRYENGIYLKPNRENLIKLEKAFGVKRSYFEELLEV